MSDSDRVAYSHPVYELSFTLPASLTVRKQVGARAIVGNALAGRVDEPEASFMAYWQAGLNLVEDWQCDRIPDPAALDIDAETDPVIASMVIWTANTVAGYLLDVGGESVPKNS